jgi:hypothetical protein
MRRLYFLVPNTEYAENMINDLLLARIEERHIHLIAREGTPMEKLPEASLAQKTDFIPAAQRGLMLGGTLGLLAGLAAMTFPPAGVVVGGGAVLFTTLGGAGFGAWVSSMIGVNIPNSRLQQFEEAINRGEILMLLDVPKNRVEEIEEIISGHFPQVAIKGTEPTIPAFP